MGKVNLHVVDIDKCCRGTPGVARCCCRAAGVWPAPGAQLVRSDKRTTCTYNLFKYLNIPISFSECHYRDAPWVQIPSVFVDITRPPPGHVDTGQAWAGHLSSALNHTIHSMPLMYLANRYSTPIFTFVYSRSTISALITVLTVEIQLERLTSEPTQTGFYRILQTILPKTLH